MIGVMEVKYVTTSCTLVKARAQIFHTSIRKADSRSPTTKAIDKVTLTAKYADFGQPAPSSFEILVLLNGN